MIQNHRFPGIWSTAAVLSGTTRDLAVALGIGIVLQDPAPGFCYEDQREVEHSRVGFFLPHVLIYGFPHQVRTSDGALNPKTALTNPKANKTITSLIVLVVRSL